MTSSAYVGLENQKLHSHFMHNIGPLNHKGWITTRPIRCGGKRYLG